MRSFYYRPGKTAFFALLLGGVGLFFGKTWLAVGGFMPMLLMAIMLAGAAKLAFDAMSRDPAVRFDEHNLWVRKGLGGMHQVPWRDVHHIGLKVITIRYGGIIPVGRTEHVVVTCNGGTLGTRRLRLATSTMELPPGGGSGLVHVLQKAHEASVGVAAAAMAGAGSVGWGVDRTLKAAPEESQETFDADAALARYLAQKEAAAKSRSAPAAPAPAVQPHMPQRPVFGRRVG
jgi:hypothetical protein